MPLEIVVPQMGESIVEATVAQWLKKPGEAVKAREALVELETDKVNQVIEADADGVLTQILAEVGATVAVGQAIGILEAGATASVPAPAPTQAAPPAPASAGAGRDSGCSRDGSSQQCPAGGRRRHRPRRQDRQGRCRGEDRNTQGDRAARCRSGSPAAPRPPSERPIERLPMARKRKTIAANLKHAQNTAAILTTFNEVDMSKVMELRTRRKADFEGRFGVGLGFMSFFTKATIGALKQFPMVNAEIDDARGEIILKKYYDIGIAVGLEDGLVVSDHPRCRQAQLRRDREEDQGTGGQGKRGQARAF